MSEEHALFDLLDIYPYPPPLQLQKTPLLDADQRMNSIIVNSLRTSQEKCFRDRLSKICGRWSLQLSPELPLPDLQKKWWENPKALNIEHLHDMCNKTIAIYQTGHGSFDGSEKLILYLFDQWVLTYGGDIHKVDINFARFFAKNISLNLSNRTGSWEPATTQQVSILHQALIEASTNRKRTGYEKERLSTGPNSPSGNHFFLADHQIEHFHIKPLYKALFMIIEDQMPENENNLEMQKVRLVRTGYTDGLRHPITFANLDIQEAINADEVVVTLQAAFCFVMELERMECSGNEERDAEIMDDWLGPPEIELRRFHTNTEANPKLCYWTGGKELVPKGPSTAWYTDGLPTLQDTRKAARAQHNLEQRKIAPMKGMSAKKENMPLNKDSLKEQSPTKTSSGLKDSIEEWRSGLDAM